MALLLSSENSWFQLRQGKKEDAWTCKTTHKAGEKHEEEGDVERNHYHLTTATTVHFPEMLGKGGGGAGNEGMSLSLGRRGLGGRWCLNLSYCPNQFYLAINLFSPSLFCSWQLLISDLNLPTFILTHEFFHPIFSPCPFVQESSWVVSCNWPRSTHQNCHLSISFYLWRGGTAWDSLDPFSR